MKEKKQLVPSTNGNRFRQALAEISQVFRDIDPSLAETFLERVTGSEELRRDEALYPLLVEMCNSLNNDKFIFLAPIAPLAVVLVYVPKHYEADQAGELVEAVSGIIKAGGATVFVAEHRVGKWIKSNIRTLVPPANLRKVFRVLCKRGSGLGNTPCWTTQTAILGLRHLDQAVADPMWSVAAYGNTPKNLRSLEYTRGIRALDHATTGSLGIRLTVLFLLLLTTYLLVPLLVNYGFEVADPNPISFLLKSPILGSILLVASVVGTVITSFLFSAYVHGLLYQEIGTKVLIKKLQAIAEIKIADTKEPLSKLTDIADLAFEYLLTKQGAGAGFLTTLIIATIPGIVTAVITGKVGLPQPSMPQKLEPYIPLAIVVIYIFGILLAFYLANKASRAVRALALHRIRLETLSSTLLASSNCFVTARGESLTGKEAIAAI